jgi:poly(A) polymerase/tRNA nucleotidyltransferase (CCA-adding enzyme)
MATVKFTIPNEVSEIGKALMKAGFEAYLVGGCVRDVFLGVTPKDWDIATNAKPDQIQKLFSESVYENQFGTVGVKTDSEDPTVKVVEVTTYRIEGKYTDKRHPDEVRFASTIEEDLSRRDFTVNAMAFSLESHSIVDPYKGQLDLQKKIIRTVGDPHLRFNEDALRLMRAVRFSAQLGFVIESETRKAIAQEAGLLEFIAKERIADELSKLLMTDRADEGIREMQKLGLLKFVLPELEEGVGVGQNKHHIYEVFEHNVRALEYAVKNNFSLELRFASLLHDVGKPETKRGKGLNSTFYGHQVVGERMAIDALDRLKFPKKIIEKVALLIREHMFVYDPEMVSDAGVRRLIRRVGSENVEDLMKLREADRIGSGVPKAQPYRLRYLKAMIEKVQKDPVHPKMLKIRGDVVMEILNISPGPRVGNILAVLLEEVLDNPKLNEGNNLQKRVKELGLLSDKELVALAEKAKESAAKVQERVDKEIKRKYSV